MKFRGVARLLARVAMVGFCCTIIALVGVQYARIIHRNIAFAAELHAVEHDITDLRAKRDLQRREVVRLSDPRGAIPEIHDRLHLVGDHEAIVYVKKRTDP